MNAYRKNINMLNEWLFSSGIHYLDKKNNLDAFYGDYNKNNNSYSFIYCEITGYAINYFLNLYKLEQEKKYLEVAKRAGYFILTKQYQENDLKGSMPWSIDRNGRPHYLYYSFDTSMCLSSLVDLYNMTEDNRFLKAAVMAADWLMEMAQNYDGSFKAVYNSNKRLFDENILRETWSGDGGCLHIKHLMGLLKVYKVTKFEKYIESINKLLEWSLKMQKDNGSFKATAYSPLTFTHSHCYATEGIIYAFNYFREPILERLILNSAQWLLKVQNQDGSYYDYYNLADMLTRFIQTKNILPRLRSGFFNIDSNAIIKIKRTDATSQAARIMLFVYLLIGDERYKKAAINAIKFVNKMQSANFNKAEQSAVCFGLLDFRGIRRKSRLYTSWSSMFAVNAMQLFTQINNKTIDIDTFVEELF